VRGNEAPANPQFVERGEPHAVNAEKFVVALTADFYDGTGAPKYRDLGLSVLAENPPH